MPKTEDGEFELILGNRQLLSVFFIVVVLLGVFFTMGYIVGRNSAPVGATDTAKKGEPTPIVVDSATQPSPTGDPIVPPVPDAPEPRDNAATQRQTAPDELKSRTQPTSPPPAETKPLEPDPAPRTKPSPASAAPTPGEPQPGVTYLQVAAVARPEAELFVDVLARRGFHAIYVQHPQQPQLYRVLVGPFSDTSAVAQARADLNKAGFKGFEALSRKF
jgi:hypothetical protein